jgi:hypothetical protein
MGIVVNRDKEIARLHQELKNQDEDQDQLTTTRKDNNNKLEELEDLNN